MTEAFLGRQPIFDRHLELHAFELLYRGADVDFADFTEGDRATSQVLLNALTDFGMDRVAGAHPVFVNLTRGFVIGEYPLPVPKERFVLEILEDVMPDEEVLLGLARFREAGYRIALDDYVYTDETEALLEYADIVKVDIQGLGAREIRDKVELLRPFGAELLAEKIETRFQLDVCRQVGFGYFQGYFLARPRVLKADALPVCRSNVVRLLAELQEPVCDERAIRELVRGDLPLSYRILRFVGAQSSVASPIVSIEDAIERLGFERLREFASLILVCELEDASADLFLTARFRAILCERLAVGAGLGAPERHYMVGLLSVLGAASEAPLERLVQELPLDFETREALLSGSGALGEPLRATIAYESGEWDSVGCLGLPRESLQAAFHEAAEQVESAAPDLHQAA